MSKFFIKLIIFASIFSVVVLVFEMCLPEGYSDDVILSYQKKKMQTATSVNAAFFGDSSCGNAISAEVFGNNMYNFSLTGEFGYAGTLEMVKLCKRLHPELKRVFIMQSFDVLRRKTNRSRFVNQEMNRYETVTRNMYVFGEKVMNFNYKELLKNNVIIENDYLEQKSKVPPTPMIIKSPISEASKKAILDMAEYFRKEKMEYVIILGPSTDIVENVYYKEAMDFFHDNNIPFIRDNFPLNKENIGDSNDHVGPAYKKESTLFYKDKINNFFTKNAFRS